MRYRHYAPRAELIIVEGENRAVIDYVNSRSREIRAAGGRSGIISTDDNTSAYECDIIKNVGSRGDYGSVAHNLYRVLREFDDEGADTIFSESFMEEREDSAIMNRLLKAAGYKVVRL